MFPRSCLQASQLTSASAGAEVMHQRGGASSASTWDTAPFPLTWASAAPFGSGVMFALLLLVKACPLECSEPTGLTFTTFVW